MTCLHTRKMSVFMKHNDMANMQIPHLDVDLQDYLPHIGIFGGDDTQFEVCMDCGQIQRWKQITDEAVLEDDRIASHLEKKNHE